MAKNRQKIFFEKAAIYFLLLSAFFNAVLRVSPDSNLTLFRLLLPLSLFVIYSVSRRNFYYLLIVFSIVFLLSFFQYSSAKLSFYSYVTSLTIAHLIEYLFHFLCILVLVFLVLSLKVLSPRRFFRNYISFGALVVKALAVVYIIYIFTGGVPASFLLFGNINDFSCVLTIGIGLVIFDRKTYLLFKLLWVVLFFSYLLLNDSSLAFFGALVWLALYLAGAFSTRRGKLKRMLPRLLLLSIGVISFVVLINSLIFISGYNIQDIISDSWSNLVNGEFYPDSNNSLSYRTNAIVGIFSIIKNTLGIGVGLGNTSLILKTIVPDPDLTFGKYSYMASHIWWFELMSDFGWIAIVIILYLFIQALRYYFKRGVRYKKMFSILFLITFPIWSMSSSGLYTEFFTLSMLAFAIEESNFLKIKIQKKQLSVQKEGAYA